MKAIILKQAGLNPRFEVQELPLPKPKKDEVLVKVHAIGINPVDLKTAAGKAIYDMLKDEKPLILGWDISGVVVAMGDEATDFEKEDAVFGMVNFPGHGKAYAEYVAVPQNQLAKKPKNIFHEQAAASGLAALTAWQFLVNKAWIKTGDRVLIHAASGGVGHFAVQIGKYFKTYVIGSSSAENRDFILSLGADDHIDYQTQAFEDHVSDIDIVLDTIGGDYIERSAKVLKEKGVIITTPSELNKEDIKKAKAKDINVFYYSVESNGEDMKSIATLLEKGAILPHVSHTYSFDQIEEAHKQIAGGRTKGKVVIKLI